MPKSSRKQILQYLKLIRDETGYHHPIQLKGLDQKGKRFECTRLWIEVATHALIQDLKSERYPTVYNGVRTCSPCKTRQATRYSKIIEIKRPLKARFVLFRERHNHKKMHDSFMPDHASKIETTFRMGLKCGMHFLFDESDPVYVDSIHFHGSEQYRRNVDKMRIIDRLKTDLRDYCLINDKIDDRTGNHTKPDSQDYDDCQLLQLSDLLVGAFRTIRGATKNNIQREVSLPVKNLIEKWEAGFARMRNSRWYKGYCIAECYIDNGKWNFANVINETPNKWLF